MGCRAAGLQGEHTSLSLRPAAADLTEDKMSGIKRHLQAERGAQPAGRLNDSHHTSVDIWLLNSGFQHHFAENLLVPASQKSIY